MNMFCFYLPTVLFIVSATSLIWYSIIGGGDKELFINSLKPSGKGMYHLL
jgi:hypothetical protein